jgi:hypothetical protein
VTARKADRYLRLGGRVPVIYFGTLAGVVQAISDAKAESRFAPDATITVWAVRGRGRERIRAFQAGREQEAS